MSYPSGTRLDWELPTTLDWEIRSDPNAEDSSRMEILRTETSRLTSPGVPQYAPESTTVNLFRDELCDGNGYVYERVLIPQPSSDPNDPLNWGWQRRYLTLFNVGLFTFASDFSLGSIIPCLGIIQEEFHLSDQKVLLIQAVNILFLGLGCLIWTPLAAKFGKRPTLLIACAVFLGGLIWNMVTTTYSGLLCSRIVQGIGAAASHGLVPGTVSDVSFLHERATKLAIYDFCMGAGGAGAPIFTGFIVEDTGDWRWVTRMVTILVLISFLLMLFTLPETKFNREFAVRHASKARLRSFFELLSFRDGYDRDIYWRDGFHRTLEVWKRPALHWATLNYAITLSATLAMAAVLLYRLTGPPYNFSIESSGWTYISPLIGAGVGMYLGGYVCDKWVMRMSRNYKGVFEPEFRLISILPLYVSGPLGLLLFAFGTDIHWILPVTGFGMGMFAFVAVPNVALTYFMDCYKDNNDISICVLVLLRNCISVGVLMGVQAWMLNLGIKKMFLMLTGIELAVFLLAWPMYIFGKRFRTTCRIYPEPSRKTSSILLSPYHHDV